MTTVDYTITISDVSGKPIKYIDGIKWGKTGNCQLKLFTMYYTIQTNSTQNAVVKFINQN